MKKLAIAVSIILATTLLAASAVYAKIIWDYNVNIQTTTVAQPVAPSTEELLRLTNEERAKVGSPALALNPVMADAAQWKSDDMVAHNYWQHKLPGTTVNLDEQHLQSVFAQCQMVQENLSKDGNVSASAIDGWMGSTTGHREALLNPASSSVGYGITQQKDGTYLIAAEFCIAK